MALDRPQIARAALDLLDDVGLEGLTLRLLAARLDVKAPALYWHFASKAALLDEMATTMLRDSLADGALAPGEEAGDWVSFLEASSSGLHEMMRSRRDGARVFAGTFLTDDELVASSERPLRILTGAGFSVRDATWAWQTIYDFVVGFTIEEQAVSPDGAPDPRFVAERRQERLSQDRAPLAHESSAHMFGDVNARFAFGVQVLIAGLGAQLSANPDRPDLRGDNHPRP